MALEPKTLEELLVAGVKHGVSDVHFRPGGQRRTNNDMFKPSDYPDISKHPRMQREAKTVSAMIDISCTEYHGTPKGQLCGACAELLDYAMLRLSRCPFQEGKTSCGNCKVHCYKPDMRERARETMRTAGPRMPLSHPLMTLWHFFDGLRKEPVRKK